MDRKELLIYLLSISIGGLVLIRKFLGGKGAI